MKQIKKKFSVLFFTIEDLRKLINKLSNDVATNKFPGVIDICHTEECKIIFYDIELILYGKPEACNYFYETQIKGSI